PETQVTGAGTIVGTPYYMSPEQVQAKPLDARSDVYALGAIMYECVVGKPPFEAPNPVGVLSKHLTEQPLPPSSRSPISVPPEADAIIMRCLEKDREDRYSSVEALRLDLIAYLSSVGDDNWRVSASGSAAGSSGMRPVDSLFAPRRRGWWWAAAVVVAAIAAAATWRYVARGPVEGEPNHTEVQANRLPPDTEIEGYLGQRLDETTGDVDLFAINRVGAELSPAVFELSAIPNMDVTLELLRPGEGPFIVADSGGVGEGERLPNVPLETGTYFIRVREHQDSSDRPTENVSDPYYLRWRLREADSEFENEPNDSLEQAEALRLGEERRAWIGWPRDVDTFCLSEDAPRVVAQVSALAGVDLVLRVVDRRSERSEKRDASGVNRAETSKTWRNAKAGQLCVEVSADPGETAGAPAQADETYGVRFISGASP
ncbi:MAG: serine/threonine-protein kinase, partial [Myxococcota bacterium]